jgi:hypothetical protein
MYETVLKIFCGGFCVSSLTWAVGFIKDIWGEGRIKCVLETFWYLFLYFKALNFIN